MAQTQAKAQATQGAVSLRPSTFTQGGSLVDDADLLITKARFVMTDYGGKADAEVCVLSLDLTDGDATEHNQLYSVGTGFVPSETGDEAENGRFLVPVGDKTAVASGSNFAMLLNSLVNAGFPEDLLDSGVISELEGLKAHMNRVPQPKRSNLPARGGAEKKYEATILVFTSIVHLPGEAPKTAAKTSAKVTTINKAAPGKAAAPAAAEDDASPLADELAEALMGIFAAEGLEELKKVQVVQKLFAAIPKDNPNRKELLALAGKSEVLGALDGFTFDGTLLKMG